MFWIENVPTTRQWSSSVILFLAALTIPAAAAARAADVPNASHEKELLAVLRSSAPASEKAITCKQLAIHGSPAAVRDLAPLLHDPQLASWARIALEAIPGTAADEALRRAADSLHGRALVGTINSIGVRRDTSAVKLLGAHLQDDESQVASAAAVALGYIGNGPATRLLRQSLSGDSVEVRSAVVEGCVLCAERLVAAGKLGEAAAIYD